MTQKPEFYLIFDIRSTVFEEDQDSAQYDSEIIEISVIAVDANEYKIINNQFHSFVQPIKNPTLSEKCKELTKIKQYRIDQSEPWPVVLKSLQKWMNEQKYTDKNSVIIADGSFEYEKNLLSQSNISGLKIPSWMKQWINVRKDFKEATECSESLDKLNLYKMLDIAGVTFEGTKMDGHDEAFNLALLVVNMGRQNYEFHNFENIKQK